MNTRVSRRILRCLVLQSLVAAPLFAQDSGKSQDSPQPTARERNIQRTPRNPTGGTAGELRPTDGTRSGEVNRGGAAPQAGAVDQRSAVRWSLGAAVDSLDTGCRVKSVTPRSPAEKLGLQRDDVIVAVGGFQVGRVDGVEFPLDDELQRRADASGRVRLLVLDRRARELKSLEARLDRGGSAATNAVIRGEAIYRERMALPSGAELRLRLVRKQFAAKETIAEHTVANISGSPIRFELPYSADSGDAKKSCELEAEIWAGGKRLMIQDSAVEIRAGQSGDVRISLRRA
ncbi:MAG: YbaY family lipoprotein [Phycisphaerae bacterium]